MIAGSVDLTVDSIDRMTIEVPFRDEIKQHMLRWLPHVRYFDVFRVELGSDHIGYGETMRFGTWERATPKDIDRVLGKNAIEILWDGSLGAGLQMALFDATGKAVDAPVRYLIGAPCRDRSPISWWAMDLPPKGWVKEGERAHRHGFDTIKLKGRPWFDIRDAVEQLGRELPGWFAIDIDFNETLLDAERAIPLLKELERIPQVNCFESPVPEHKHGEYREIRDAVETDIAMHYGEASKDPTPAPTDALCEDVCDVFVGGGGPNHLREQDEVLGAWDRPFWVQLRGTGISTAYALQIGSVLRQATWPAITRHHVYDHNLLTSSITVEDGMVELPEEAGLGYSVDIDAIQQFRVDPPESPPKPGVLIEITRRDGTITYFTNTTQMQNAALQGEFPFYERDIHTRIVPKDEDDWEERYREAENR